ncbi:MAG: hypothetical protein C4570_03810 [Ammonifex sp.]|nr:MAG: hypothetical protein C4570_03810 [Ammonifex sp.]
METNRVAVLLMTSPLVCRGITLHLNLLLFFVMILTKMKLGLLGPLRGAPIVMRKQYLSLIVDGAADGDQVRITSDRPGAKEKGGLVKYSPLYSVSSDYSVQPLPTGNGCILFFFSLNSYEIFRRIFKQFGDQKMGQFWTSNGWASFIAFCNSEGESWDIIKYCDGLTVGFEKWIIENWVVKDAKHNVIIQETGLTVFEGLDELEYALRKIAYDVVHSINNAYRLVQTYAPFYLDSVDSICKVFQEIVSATLYLMGKWEYDKFEKSMIAINSGFSHEKVIDVIGDYKISKKSIQDKLITLDQLQDEMVQIYAVLKSMTSQAFCGTAPIRNNSYRSGEYSLLGISGAYFGLVSIYRQVKNALCDIDLEHTFLKTYKEWPAPDILRVPNEYDKWRQRLDELSWPDYKKSGEKLPQTHHVLYFSNRLGFRETKHSISASYQSIAHACAQPWSLNTLTHEYAHAINRAILSSLFAQEKDITKSEVMDVYYVYRGAFNNGKKPKNLLQFFKVLICWAATCLAGETSNEGTIPDPLDPKRLAREIRRGYHLIDEVMVHLFDYHYFYDCEVNLFIRSAWASWLVLPMTMGRKDEYFLRTIMVIASAKPGRAKDRFEWSFDSLRAGLLRLKDCHYISNEAIDVLVKALDRRRKLLYFGYYYLLPLVDSVSKIMVSRMIKSRIRSDDKLEPDKNGRESYNIKYGSYDSPPIKNPIMFILDQLQDDIANDTNLPPMEVEYRSLWMMSVLCASLS